MEHKPPKLLDQLCEAIWVRHYSVFAQKILLRLNAALQFTANAIRAI